VPLRRRATQYDFKSKSYNHTCFWKQQQINISYTNTIINKQIKNFSSCIIL
jgi:hypothetical protein